MGRGFVASRPARGDSVMMPVIVLGPVRYRPRMRFGGFVDGAGVLGGDHVRFAERRNVRRVGGVLRVLVRRIRVSARARGGQGRGLHRLVYLARQLCR